MRFTQVQFVPASQLKSIRAVLADRGVRVLPHPSQPLWLSRAHAAELGVPVDADTPAELLCIVDPRDVLGSRPAVEQIQAYTQRQLLYANTVRQSTDAELPADVQVDADFYITSNGLALDDATEHERRAIYMAEYTTVRVFDPAALPWIFPAVPDGSMDDSPVSPNGYVPRAIQPDAIEKLIEPIQNAQEAKAVEADLANENYVRVAIALTRRAGGAAGAVHLNATLLPGLSSLLQWDEGTVTAWRAALPPLLEAATGGYWNAAAKVLYDLQKLTGELIGDVYEVDVGGWATSFGKRPLLRKLTVGRTAIVLKCLRRVSTHLHTAGLSPAAADVLQELLAADNHRVTERWRDELRPRIDEAMRSGGLEPAAGNTIEAVARSTITEELLDQLCTRGHTRLSHLRDSIAQHALKLADIPGPLGLLRGDALLKTDRALAGQLDGMHNRGEFYLRALQRFSAVGFGTAVGRWLTKFAIIPFGAAILTVEFAKYVVYESTAIAVWVSTQVAAEDATEEIVDTAQHAEPHGHGPLFSTESVTAMLLIGVLYLLLLHVPAIRALAGRVMRWLGDGLHRLFVAWPLAVWHSAPLRWLRSNRLVVAITRLAGWPLIAGMLMMGFFLVCGANWWRSLRWGLGALLTAGLFLNIPVGRRVQNALDQSLNNTWRYLLENLLPNLWNAVVWAFRELLALLDRLLYSVDEWLRYRPGQSKPSLIFKVLVAVVWFPVAYVIRFAFYLLIEPQVNPVKHFPVVTVSHKLLLPMIPSLSKALNLHLEVVGAVVSGIPGIFGFAVWELKENWRLYRANAPRTLQPAHIGHHGETALGLLQPGFHSGTVPATYRKLRALLHSSWHRNTPAIIGKFERTLHDVEHAVAAWLHRQTFVLIANTAAWKDHPIVIEGVHLGLQRIEVELAAPTISEANCRLLILRRNEAILCVPPTGGFVDSLNAEQRAVWSLAFVGLAATAGDAIPVNAAEWNAGWH